MRVGTYNPMSLVEVGRQRDISRELAHVDALALPATRLRADKDQPIAMMRLIAQLPQERLWRGADIIVVSGPWPG